MWMRCRYFLNLYLLVTSCCKLSHLNSRALTLVLLLLNKVSNGVPFVAAASCCRIVCTLRTDRRTDAPAKRRWMTRTPFGRCIRRLCAAVRADTTSSGRTDVCAVAAGTCRERERELQEETNVGGLCSFVRSYIDAFCQLERGCAGSVVDQPRGCVPTRPELEGRRPTDA